MTASTIAKPKITFFGDRTPLPVGTYVIRIIVSANNAAPTTHLIRIELTNEMRLQFAKWRERWAIRKADRQAMKGQISKGMMAQTHLYEVRPRKDHRGVDLISDALPFGRLWYGEPDAISNAIGYAKSLQPIT